MRQEQISRTDIARKRRAASRRRAATTPQAQTTEHHAGGPGADLDEDLLHRIEVVLARADACPNA